MDGDALRLDDSVLKIGSKAPFQKEAGRIWWDLDTRSDLILLSIGASKVYTPLSKLQLDQNADTIPPRFEMPAPKQSQYGHP